MIKLREILVRPKSGKTRYVIVEYIVPRLVAGETVYYMGETSRKGILECIKSYLGEEKILNLSGKLINLESNSDLENTNYLKGELLVVDKHIMNSEIDIIKHTFNKLDITIIRQVKWEDIDSNKGNIIDNGKHIRFDPETLEKY